MVSPEAPTSPEDGFIAKMQELLNYNKGSFDVTDLVNKYLETSSLIQLNIAIRFCCSKGINRPQIIATDGGEKYTLTRH